MHFAVESLGNTVSIHLIGDEFVDGLDLNVSYISKATYYRYFIGDILKDKDVVLYLDVDILINDSLRELIDVDLMNSYAAGVWDRCISKLDDGEYLEKQGMGEIKKSYLNAGVLLLNVRKFRLEKLSAAFLNNHRKLQGKIRFQDQDVLNYTFCGDVVLLDKKNNLMTYERDRHPFRTRFLSPNIVHFTGPDKPWAKGCGFWGAKYREEVVRMESFLTQLEK